MQARERDFLFLSLQALERACVVCTCSTIYTQMRASEISSALSGVRSRGEVSVGGKEKKRRELEHPRRLW